MHACEENTPALENNHPKGLEEMMSTLLNTGNTAIPGGNAIPGGRLEKHIIGQSTQKSLTLLARNNSS